MKMPGWIEYWGLDWTVPFGPWERHQVAARGTDKAILPNSVKVTRVGKKKNGARKLAEDV